MKTPHSLSKRTGDRKSLPEDLFVCFLVKTNDKCLPDQEGGSSEISGGTEKAPDQNIIFRRSLLHVVIEDLFPLRDHHSPTPPSEFESLFRALSDLLRIHLLFDHRFFTQELLGPLAARSACAVVGPTDSLHHSASSLATIRSRMTKNFDSSQPLFQRLFSWDRICATNSPNRRAPSTTLGPGRPK